MSYSSTPPPPPQNPYGSPGGYGAAPVGTNQKAVWSLVTGILGLVCCGLFTGIPAIFLARSAKADIARTGQGGGGMATAGLVLGIIAVAWSALYLILILTGVVDLSFDFDSN